MNESPQENEARENGPQPPARGASRKLTALLVTLPAGQYRVAAALVADNLGPTYPQVAANLGLSAFKASTASATW